MDLALIAWFVFLSPLIAFPLSYFAGLKWKNWSGIIASSSIAVSLILSFILYLYYSVPVHSSYNWFYSFNYGIFVDHLSIAMVMMVSFVSLMIHLFAIYYMGKDPNRHVYFAETSLFTAGMLGLVLSSNLLEFFLFWELVGLCSYLLIGFWFFKPNAASAAKKAFIVTRVGDMSFVIGLAVLYSSLSPLTANPLSIPFLINNMPFVLSVLGSGKLALVSILFLGGAIGKSSQFPLHVWIPDAMEGPTTVSALIHAATMVTAGIYLVARIYPLYYYSGPDVLYTLAIIGSFTAIFAGILGLVVNDIKRILAYSTISQLGYMLSALGLFSVIGLSAVGYAMFHLFVHAFFKAMLFMGAGVILLTLMELRDVKRMGGLWKRMPITVSIIFIGALALSAIYPTAGYFSKDEIISAAYVYMTSSGAWYYALPWIFLTVGAFLTAAYTFRMFFLVALGKPRSELADHAKDPSILVLLPLIPLAILSIIYGFFRGDFLSYLGGSNNLYVPLYIKYLPLTLALLGILVTYLIYGRETWMHMDLSKSRVYSLVKNKFYMDKLFTGSVAERGILPISGKFASFENSYNTDVEKLGRHALDLGTAMRKLQSGVIESYFALIILGSAVVFIIALIVGVI
ncbi:MAG: NADH-quinone oxidoreductase subunit L [Candidatus Thermoplasmatota archaeon]|nr:NADH-quinone oxidoreductase subunit L [Candidatus Thermoplasmatota archaeon]MCL5731746.1 NADH-quinone oxidoreductase subunit L [Candidatus Thermoplasmatota archaeon]